MLGKLGRAFRRKVGKDELLPVMVGLFVAAAALALVAGALLRSALKAVA